MSDLQLRGSLEDNILCMLTWSDDHAAAIALKVDPGLFSTRAYQRIAGMASDYLAEHGRPPRAHLRDLLEEELSRGDDGRFLSQILDAMDRLHEEMQPEYILPQLDRFIQIRKLTHTVERMADSLHAGDLEAAQEALGEVEYKVSDRPGVWLHDTEEWLKFLEVHEEEIFTSGVDILDQRSVTPRLRSLFLVIGSAGTGKSFWLRQIARDNVVQLRKRVLHITLENDLDETLQFYTMAFLSRSSEAIANLRVPIFQRDKLGRYEQLDYAQITPDVIAPEKRRAIAKDLEKFQKRGRLLVKWFPTGTLTVAQLSNFLDLLKRTENFEPEVVVLDYADLMYTDERNLRVSTGRLFRDLRGLAGIRNFAMVTATQGNRYSAEAKMVTANLVAEDWSKIGTADTVVTYSQTLAEKDLGIARLMVAKSRRSRDKWIALITQSYATGQFCMDSTFFNKLVQDQVARATGAEEAEG